jgi:5-formyltetrahydrofolate cyclo-ligase
MSEAQDAEEKARVRATLRARRRALLSEDVRVRGERVQARLLSMPEWGDARTVALYAALPGEVPTEALLAGAFAQGKTVAFPVVPTRGRCLGFRAVDAAGQLAPAGPLRIAEPGDGRPEVPLQSIDLFVVPGLGFTRAGHRLGQGKGYYDATLARAPAGIPRVGLAFSEHVLAALPVGPGDVPMTWVLTEDMAFAAPGVRATVLGARPQ